MTPWPRVKGIVGHGFRFDSDRNPIHKRARAIRRHLRAERAKELPMSRADQAKSDAAIKGMGCLDELMRRAGA